MVVKRVTPTALIAQQHIILTAKLHIISFFSKLRHVRACSKIGLEKKEINYVCIYTIACYILHNTISN
jgi:hypothetical protein